MFSFSIHVPRFGRRSSQPPSKSQLSNSNQLPAVALKSSRSQSIGPQYKRRKPVPAPLQASKTAVKGFGVPEALTPCIVDVEPKVEAEGLTSIAHTKRYNSLPPQLRHDTVESSPKRGRLPRRKETVRVLHDQDRAHASTFYNHDYYTEYDWQPRREISSDARGRQFVVERERSRNSRLFATTASSDCTTSSKPHHLIVPPSREGSSHRSASKHTRSRSAAAVIHITSDRVPLQRPRSASRQSSQSETSTNCQSEVFNQSPLSVTGSSVRSVFTASTTPSLRVNTRKQTKIDDLLEMLETDAEPSLADSASSAETTTTRYRYRYTPVEDDVASIKSFVRKMETGGRQRQTGKDRSATCEPAGEENHTEAVADGGQSPPQRRRAHVRSVSHGTIDGTPQLAPANRHVRSASVAPSSMAPSSTAHYSPPAMSPVLSAAIPPSIISSSSPTVARRRPSSFAARPRFAERFSVCLESDPSDTPPSMSGAIADSRQVSDEAKRMRRVNRVLKMAEYAAGRR